MEAGLIALVAAVLIIGAVLWAVIYYFPNTPNINRQKYQSKWMDIEGQLQRGGVDSMHMAILNADKLLDQALKETGSRGSTMGERMKNRQAIWSNANAVWSAHKLRNQIAHDEHVQLTGETARRALASFKKALGDLGVL